MSVIKNLTATYDNVANTIQISAQVAELLAAKHDLFLELRDTFGGVIKAISPVPDTVINAATPIDDPVIIGVPIFLPLDIDTARPPNGDLPIQIIITDTSLPVDNNIVEDIEDVIEFCLSDLSPNLLFLVDCFCRSLVLRDNTVYPPGFIITSGGLTLNPPIIAGQPAPVPIFDGALNPITTTLSYTNVTYVGILDVAIQYTVAQSGGVLLDIVNVLVQQTLEQKIDCQYNLCKLMDCIQNAWDLFKAQAGKVGGVQAMPQAELGMWIELGILLDLHNQQIECQDFDNAKKNYDCILELIGCTCDEPEEGPQPLDPLCAGAGGGATFNYAANPPLLVTVLAGTVTYFLDPVFVARLNALYTTDIVTSDPQASLTTVTDPEGDKTVTFNQAIETVSAVTDDGVAVITSVIPPAGVVPGVRNYDIRLIDREPWTTILEGNLLNGLFDYSTVTIASQIKLRFKVDSLGALHIDGRVTLTGLPIVGTLYDLCNLPPAYYTAVGVRYCSVLQRQPKSDTVGLLRIDENGGNPLVQLVFNSKATAVSELLFCASLPTDV